MLERFKAHLDKDFSKYQHRTAEVDDLYEELLGMFMDKAEALKSSGLTEDEIFEKCVNDVGDYRETLNAIGKSHRLTFFQVLKTVLVWTFAWYAVVILGYLITSFATRGWSWSWLIIVSAVAVWLVVMDIYIVNVCKKADLKHFVRFGTAVLAILLDLCVFFLFAGITGAWKIAWLIPTAIPFLISAVDAIVCRAYIGKVYFWHVPSVIFTFGIAAFLVAAQMFIGYAYAWLILLGCVVIDLLYGCFKFLYGKNRR